MYYTIAYKIWLMVLCFWQTSNSSYKLFLINILNFITSQFDYIQIYYYIFFYNYIIYLKISIFIQYKSLLLNQSFKDIAGESFSESSMFWTSIFNGIQ